MKRELVREAQPRFKELVRIMVEVEMERGEAGKVQAPDATQGSATSSAATGGNLTSPIHANARVTG